MIDAENLVWMDLEMTGLDPETDVILEIATVITDKDLNILAEGPNLTIHHDAAVLAAMGEWCRRQHAASGLSDRVLASTVTVEEAEAETLAFLKRYVPERASPLCGNSIHQDRRFLCRTMPRLEAWLHYRNIDVSSIKELCRRWYPEVALPRKKEAHRALGDVRESIAELRYYRRKIFRSDG